MIVLIGLLPIPIPLRDENHVHNSENDAPPPEVPDVPAEPPLRRSGRTRVIPSRPDNVYGDRTPTEIIRDVERQTYWKKTVEGLSRTRSIPPVQLPQPDSSMKRDSDDPLDNDEDALLKLQKEQETRECYFDGFWMRRLHATKITKIGQDASRILKRITDQIRHA